MERVSGDSIEGFTQLHKAVYHAQVERLASLLAQKNDDPASGKPYDVNARCVLKQTPLILCVRQHYEGEKQGKGELMCKLLLDHGAAVVEDGKLIRDAYGDATLHLAAMAVYKNGPAMIKMLLEKISEEVTNPTDLTEIISESCENFKNTPLHWVALNGDLEAAKLFIDKGARLGKKNRLKEKVVDYAKKYHHPKLLVMVEAEEERRAAKIKASS